MFHPEKRRNLPAQFLHRFFIFCAGSLRSGTATIPLGIDRLHQQFVPHAAVPARTAQILQLRVRHTLHRFGQITLVGFPVVTLTGLLIQKAFFIRIRRKFKLRQSLSAACIGKYTNDDKSQHCRQDKRCEKNHGFPSIHCVIASKTGAERFRRPRPRSCFPAGSNQRSFT